MNIKCIYLSFLPGLKQRKYTLVNNQLQDVLWMDVRLSHPVLEKTLWDNYFYIDREIVLLKSQ